MREFSKIILGTVQFGLNYGINNKTGKPDETMVGRILDAAGAKGVKILDSAEAYGNAHEVIGNYHRKSKNRFDVITKFSSSREDLSGDLITRIHQNAEVLGVEQLYSYMFHSFKDYETFFEDLKKPLSEAKKKGVLKKTGVSIYTNEEFESVIKDPEIDLVQLPFNVLDNNFHRSKLISQARAKGKEIHTRSVFLQGLFFKELSALPEKLQRLTPYLEQLGKISRKHEINLNSLALNYVLQQPDIDGVLIGVDTVHQLNENLEQVGSIKKEVVSLIDEIKVKEKELLNPANWNA